MILSCPKCQQAVTTEEDRKQCPRCGTTLTVFQQNTIVGGREAPETAPSLKVSGYEVVQKLDEGGMGMVFEARQLSLNRKVAIKVLAPRLAKDASFVARFEREVEALVRLHHPNIVTIFDQGAPTRGWCTSLWNMWKGRMAVRQPTSRR